MILKYCNISNFMERTLNFVEKSCNLVQKRVCFDIISLNELEQMEVIYFL